MRLITHFLAAGILLCAYQLGGQITTTFSPATITGAVNSTLDLQLKVSGFTDISTFQCPITYNAAVLQYLSADGFGLPGLGVGSIGNPQAPAPRVTISYLPDPGQYPNGVTVANNTSIITLHFKVVANGTSNVNLATGFQPSVEAYNKDGAQIAINFQNGGASVTGGNGTGGGGNVGFQIQAHADTVAPNEIFCMPITVNDFTLITTMQYAMHWDKAVLQYTEVQDINLAGLTAGAGNFTLNAATGTLALSWLDNDAVGITKTNGTAIYKVCFKAIGPVNSSSLITFDGIGIIGGAEVTSAASPVGGTNIWTATSGVSATVRVAPPIDPPDPSDITFTADQDTVLAGGQTCIAVKVKNFNDITTAQFGMTYDPSKVTLVPAPNMFVFGANPLGLNATTISPALSPGKITFAWLDQTTEGVTLPNNTTIFSVCFNATGAVGTSSAFTFASFTSPPLEIEVSQDGNPPTFLTPVFNNGSIYITNVPPCSFTATIGTVQNVQCFGGSNGSINLSTSGAIATAYNWAGPSGFGGSSQQNLTNLTAGTYTVTVTANAGCNATATTTVTQPTAVSVSAITPTHVSCAASGAIAITPAGGNGPYTYNWVSNTGYTSNQQNPSGLAAGNYTVTVTAGGCTATATTTVNSSTSNLSVTSITPTHVTCNTTGSIAITHTGGAGSTYNWASSLGYSGTQQNPSGLTAGTYFVTVTSVGGCTTTSMTTVISTSISVPMINPIPVSCFGGSNGGLDITVAGANSPVFLWTSTVMGFNSTNTEDLTNLKAGNYIVSITDASGCTFLSGNILVSQPLPVTIPSGSISATNVKCAGGADGSINLSVSGGTAPYSYAWSGPGGFVSTQAPPLANISAGLYTVAVTDSRQCPAVVSQPISVIQPTQALAAAITSTTPVKCFGEENGKAISTVSGGTPNYTYSWKDAFGIQKSNMANPTNLAAGSYTLFVTDANNCFATTNAVQVQGPPAPLSGSETAHTNVKCFGGNTGAISITPTGGWNSSYTATWVSVQSVPNALNISGLVIGTYTPTIKDAGGCEVTLNSINITGPGNIDNTNTTVQQISCHGAADGSIAINLSGGTLPHNVVWSPGGLGGTMISGLEGGAYTATVTDANQCTAILSPIIVPEPAPITVDFAIVNQDGSTLGSITLTPHGGTTPYTYTWDHNLPATSMVSNLVAGDYSYTVTDNNDCIATATLHVETTVTPLAIVLLETTVSCENNGCALFQVMSGVAPFTFTWASNNGDPVISNEDTIKICDLGSGVYNFTVADNVGTTVAVPPVTIQGVVPPTHNAVYNNPNEDSANGDINLIEPLTNGPFTYLWNTGATTQDLMNKDSGLYIVTITSLQTNCSIVDSFPLVRIWDDLEICDGQTNEITRPSCLDSENGAIRVFICGGRKPYIYDWSGTSIVASDTSSIVNGLAAGVYTLMITDGNGTTLQQTFSLTPQSNLASTYAVLSNYNGSQVSGATECDGKVIINASGEVAPLSYTWSHGGNQRTEDDLCAGDWWAVVTDGVGCKDTLTGSLTSPAVVQIIGGVTSDFNGFGVKCKGSNEGEIQVQASGGVVPYKVKWSTGFEETLNNTNSKSKQTVLSAGVYGVTITDANGVETTQMITVTEPEAMVIEFLDTEPETFTQCDGEVLATAVNAAGIVTYTWVSRRDNGIEARAEGLCAGEILTFAAIDANGCRATAQDTVDYPDDGCRLFSPVITPGDSEGKNDYLYVTCIEEIPDNSLEVYNRWGQLVYQVVGYNNADKVWKGTNKRDQALPEGVYYYVLTYKNSLSETTLLKGYVNLLR